MTEPFDPLLANAARLEDVGARVCALELECQTLRTALAQKGAALRELHHQMRNDLQVIVSLLNLQASHAGDAAVARHLGKVSDRIRAMALLHELARGADDLAGVRLDACLRVLVEHVVSGQPLAGVALEIDVTPAEVPVSVAVDAGMLLNELVSNALQHAFPHGRGGTVRVVLSVGPDTAFLEVTDNGVGYDSSAPTSLGMTLVRVLAKRLGTLSLQTDGGTCARVGLSGVPITPVAFS